MAEDRPGGRRCDEGRPAVNDQSSIPDLTALVTIDESTALATFINRGDDPTRHAGLDPILAHVRAHIDAFHGDASSPAGRKLIASMAFAVARSKTVLEGVGEKLAREAKELPKKIDSGRKHVRDTLDKWRDEVRKPLTDWEEAEEKRINGCKVELATLKALAEGPAGTVEEISAAITATEAVSDGADRQEFREDFRITKAMTLTALREKLAWRKTYDAEQIELAKLREQAQAREEEDRKRRAVEEAARWQREQEEAVAKAAAEATERARAEAAQREQALKDQAAAAERRAQEAEARAKAEAEAEAKRVQEAAEARERNIEHRRAINRAAVDALVKGGLAEGAAKLAVQMIASGAVPAVKINY